MTNIVITMAGEGSRFRKAGFDVPKFMIEVCGKTLFEWAVSSLRSFYDQEFFFVCRKSEETKKFVKEKSKSLGIERAQVIEIDRLTKGQAETVLEAEKHVFDLDDAIIIYNIDTYVDPEHIKPKNIRGDGWIPAFRTEGDQWSFVKCGDDLRVTDITEKVRISEYGTIGLYYFKTFNLFKHCYRTNSYTHAKEEYVAPLYNVVIRDPHATVYTHILDSNAVHVLGKPEDLVVFERSFECAK